MPYTYSDTMSAKDNDTDLNNTKALFAFLQGETPEGCKIRKRNQPKLTADQAWCVIWWLGNQYWQVTDGVERCDVCGDLYHSWQEGNTLDYGNPPYSFCESCMQTDTWFRKAKRNPDKSLRP